MGGKKPSDGSPICCPPPPQGPPGSSHPAGGSPSNTRVSHNTDTVLRDLGTVGEHGLCRTTSKPNCEAIGNDTGLRAVGKHGYPSSISNLSVSPRSGGAGATLVSPRSGGAGATSVSPRSSGSGTNKGSGSPPPTPLRAGREEDEGGESPELALAPPGQAGQPQVLRRWGPTAKLSPFGCQVQGHLDAV